jgi:uncharacterized membrane protein YcaP (DUF421 family)
MTTFIDQLELALGNSTTMVSTALRVLVVYGFLLFAFRMLGRRQLSQMSNVDFITLMLLSNVVQNAMVGPDESVLGGLLGASVLLVFKYFIHRTPRLSKELEGEPIILIFQGEVMEDKIKHFGISMDDLETALREHGIAAASGAETAVLERDGSISVIPRSSKASKRIRNVPNKRSQ